VPDDRAPPPPPASCLVRPYASSQKGGTLIAGDVHDPETHRQRLASGQYRPCECGRCGHAVLHVHDYRPRLTQLAPAKEAIPIVRYICANEDCEAHWQILPAFVARWLWFNWPLVEEATIAEPREEPDAPTRRPAERTRRRWRARLASSARAIVVALAASATETVAAVTRGLGLDPPRVDLVAAFARPLSAIASLVHHVHRGFVSCSARPSPRRERRNLAPLADPPRSGHPGALRRDRGRRG